MYFDEFLQLYTSCRIVDRVLEAWDENENEETRPGFHRKGYMGHLTRIANMMVKFFLFLVNLKLLQFFLVCSTKICPTSQSVSR